SYPMNLAIIIPAYNEESTIGEVIQHVLDLNLQDMEKQIIVVDDGSSDQTGEIAKSKDAVVMRHLINRGLGGALGTGIEAALLRNVDVIVTCDADKQHSPADIISIIEPILKRSADVVIGSRMLENGGMP